MREVCYSGRVCYSSWVGGWVRVREIGGILEWPW